MPVQPCTAHQGRRGIATAGRRGAGEGICAPILLVGVHHSPYQGIPPLPVHALAAMKVLAKKCCNSNQGGLSTAPMIGLVIVAGVAIIGAPVAGMAYVTSEKGPARTWLAAAVKAGDVTRVRRIIMLGIDINARDEYGRTPLHDACWYGHKQIAELLVEDGADISTLDNFGHSPSWDAEEKEHVHILELLQDAAARHNF